MKNADKNRDPEKARKRARSDARSALRTLGLLDDLENLKDQNQCGQKTPRGDASFIAKLKKVIL